MDGNATAQRGVKLVSPVYVWPFQVNATVKRTG
jgi:hypothetical protein